MSVNPLILVFDVGTQSTRAIVFDKKGNTVHKVKIEEQLYLSDEDEIAEKECGEYWRAICAVSNQMKSEIGELWGDIIAVSVTSIRNSLVFLDKDCEPTRSAILWLDKREVNCPDKLPKVRSLLYALVGMSETCRVSRKTSYSNWVRVNQPEVWAKTAKVVVPSAYFNFKLTGNLRDSKASQAAKIPYDYKKREWQSKHALTFPIFGCKTSQMCELVEPGGMIGYITKQTAIESGLPEGLPVIASGSDKACETLGCGAVNEHTASVSLGTASSVEITTNNYVEPETFMPAYTSVYKECYNPEIQIFRGFWMVSWFHKQLALNEQKEADELGVKVEEVLDKKLKDVPVGSHGLVLQPYWGPGLRNPEAKGAIIGFTDVHTRIYMYRAVIEGIGYALLEGLENISAKAQLNITRISVSGGGSQSDIICQIMADIFGRVVYRVQTSETSGLGAAMLAFTAMKEFDKLDNAVEAMSHITTEFEPNKENNETYQLFYSKIYKKMYRSLKPIYDDLYKILGKYRLHNNKQV